MTLEPSVRYELGKNISIDALRENAPIQQEIERTYELSEVVSHPDRCLTML